jgi:hypothetical protein
MTQEGTQEPYNYSTKFQVHVLYFMYGTLHLVKKCTAIQENVVQFEASSLYL